MRKATRNDLRILLMVLIAGLALPLAVRAAVSLHNASLSVAVDPQDGSYEISANNLKTPVLKSGVGAEVDRHWLRSSDYPHHEEAVAPFEDALGAGQQATVAFSGLSSAPDLVYVLDLYNDLPYGTIEVKVVNHTSSAISVQAIRAVDATGEPRVSLGGPDSTDRIMFEAFSEDPKTDIGGLDQAPKGTYTGVRDGLIYNLRSKQSLLLAALTTDRFLTVLHLKVERPPMGSSTIGSLTMDSTGTTETVLDRDEIPPQQQVELSLPVAPGESLSSERAMFASGTDYLAELEAYGDAVRRLHHLQFSVEAPMGWWSWTAFYGGINQGEVLTNAEWLASHLKSLGYNFLHIDEGYEYARGDYVTINGAQFPDGMGKLYHQICNLGLVPAIWTAPFEVSERSWVYQNHKDWLVHDAQGEPIYIGHVERRGDRLFVLDNTNPGAQAYLRLTYRVLTRQWGIRYIKLDFMDSSLIEGYFHQPNTTAMENQRIGLKIIREAVGDDVLLDKDGSEMLNPVGLVDEGRVSVDTGHSFGASKEAAPNIAVRFYMNRNFYLSDPDAFSISKQVEPQQTWHESKGGLTLNEAEVQIVLGAVAGGMYEIGDDLPTLGSEPERMALVENKELIAMNRLGRAALPLDLMSFPLQDEQPSVFFLREDARQAMLAVFNWTERPRSHKFTLEELNLAAHHPFKAYDALNHDAPVALQDGSLEFENQPPRSVRLIKLVDTSIPPAGPWVSARVRGEALAGHSIDLSASAEETKVPAIGYQWSFGDGTEASGADVHHTYTVAGSFKVQLIVAGVEGLDTRKSFVVKVTGYPSTMLDFTIPRGQSDEPPQ